MSKRVLFIAHNSGDACGGYQFGKRWFDNIDHGASKYRWQYRRVSNLAEFDAAYQECAPDAVIFNFVPIAMGWVSQINHGVENEYPVPRIVMEHNWSDSLLPQVLNGHYPTFTHLMYSDPTFTVDDPRIFNFSRPLPPRYLGPHLPLEEEIRIGTFGLCLPHKNFPLLVREVDRQFDNATIYMHVTEPTFGPPQLDQIMAQCHAEITHPGIKIHHTSDFCSDEEVVRRLADNHINALLYRVPDHNSGLSSSTDFFVAAGRPMLFTDCAVFNHVREVSYQHPHDTFSDILDGYTTAEDTVRRWSSRQYRMIPEQAEAMMDAILQ